MNHDLPNREIDETNDTESATNNSKKQVKNREAALESIKQTFAQGGSAQRTLMNRFS